MKVLFGSLVAARAASVAAAAAAAGANFSDAGDASFSPGLSNEPELLVIDDAPSPLSEAASAASGDVVPKAGAENDALRRDHDEVWAAFEDFKRRFDKVYGDAEEESRRFDIFSSHLEHLQRSNADVSATKLATNPFADLSSSEFSSIYLREVAAPPEETLGTYLGMHQPLGKSLPEAVDWRHAGAVRRVKDQGQCGSCWAFASTGAMEGAISIANGDNRTLSEQQLLDCDDRDMGCQGGNPALVFQDYARHHGMCMEKDYPYQAREGKCRSCDEKLPDDTFGGYRVLRQGDEDALMDAVAQQPVAVAITGNIQLYFGGVFDDRCWSGSINHAVLVVGYGTDPHDGDYWLVKNSWGAHWGERGYIRLARGSNSDGPYGQCGITYMPTYPVINQGLAASVVTFLLILIVGTLTVVGICAYKKRRQLRARWANARWRAGHTDSPGHRLGGSAC